MAGRFDNTLSTLQLTSLLKDVANEALIGNEFALLDSIGFNWQVGRPSTRHADCAFCHRQKFRYDEQARKLICTCIGGRWIDLWSAVAVAGGYDTTGDGFRKAMLDGLGRIGRSDIV